MDIKTIILLIALTNILIFITLLLFIKFNKIKNKIINVYSLGKLIQSIAWILLILRNIIPNFFSIIIASIFLFFGLGIEIFSIISSDGIFRKRKLYKYLIASSLLSLGFISIYSYNINIRIAYISFAFFVWIIIAVVQLIFRNKNDKLRTFVGIFYALFSLIALTRAISAFTNSNFMLFANQYIEIASFHAIFLIIFIGITLILLLLKKETEFEILNIKDNFESFFNISNDLIFILNKKGNILHYNNTAKNRLGYYSKELLNKSILLIYSEDEKENAREDVMKILKGEKKLCNIPLQTKTGKNIYVETKVIKGKWNKKDVFYGISKDISNLKCSEEKFAKLFKANPSLITLTRTDDKKIQDINKAFLSTTGFLKDEVIGKTFEDIKLVNNISDILKLRELLLNNNSVNDYELSIRTKQDKLLKGLISIEKIQLQDVEYFLTVMKDISKQKEAEQKLISEKEFTEKIIETSNAIIVGLDKNHLIRIFNKGAEQITGYSKAEVLGKDWFKIFFIKEDYNEMNKVWDKSWGVKSTNNTNDILTKYGKPRLISWQTTGIYEDNDINNHILISIGEDITEHKKAEEKIKKLSAAVEQSANTIVITDIDGNIEYTNPKFTEITGYSAEEAIGENPRILNAGVQEKDYYAEMWHDISNGKSWKGEFCNKTKYNKLFWEQVLITPITNEKGIITNYLAIKENITAKKKAEEDAKHQQEIIQAINTIFRKIIVNESKTDIAKVCLEFAEQLTQSKFGFIGEINKSGKLDTIAISNPGWTQCKITKNKTVKGIVDMKISGIWASVIKNKQSVIINNLSSYHESVNIPEGHPPINSFIGVPLKQGNRITGIIALANKENEYTEKDRKSIESLSIALEEALSKKDVENSLLKSEKRLKELNITKDKFFSIIAHDLRNPIGILMNYSELLLMSFNRFDKEKKIKYITTINESSKLTFRLLENLLEWSRTQSNRIEFVPELFNLSHVITENINLLTINANNKNLFLQSDVLDDHEVFADKNMITTVIRNLISNAIKFTKNGGISVYSDKYDNYIKISITDTGEGIEKENIKKLFTIEDNISTKGTDGERGTGLGLILCKEFVEKNGGKIWVESEVGKGSTFYFTLSTK